MLSDNMLSIAEKVLSTMRDYYNIVSAESANNVKISAFSHDLQSWELNYRMNGYIMAFDIQTNDMSSKIRLKEEKVCEGYAKELVSDEPLFGIFWESSWESKPLLKIWGYHTPLGQPHIEYQYSVA